MVDDDMEFAHNGTEQIQKARERYLEFLGRCVAPEGLHRLTPDSEPSAYATCFWVFGMHLLHKQDVLGSQREELSATIRHMVRQARADSATKGGLGGKPYRQLLTFSLSALSILGTLADDPLEDLVREQLPDSVEDELHDHGCLRGEPQSGNQAMFLAIFLLHARDFLGLSTNRDIQAWVGSHLSNMNRFGFWGGSRGMTALQFQNGYHQYEILEYLGIETGKALDATGFVAGMADGQGHFAPYPGGGGCFDYDAVFVLTPSGEAPARKIAQLLQLTAASLLSEQRPDGGFCESLYVRPRSLSNMTRSVRHVLRALPNSSAALERLRYNVALQRRKYDRIKTHWSIYSRRWDESDLWDSWFRMLALARIECALNGRAVNKWGFIDYPGIGYHPSLRGED